MLKNAVNGKIYIGSACDLKRRINNHFWSLRKNKHANIKIQRAYNKLNGKSKTSGGYHWQYYEYYLKDKEEKEK